jgi:hypothetical protein
VGRLVDMRVFARGAARSWDAVIAFPDGPTAWRCGHGHARPAGPTTVEGGISAGMCASILLDLVDDPMAWTQSASNPLVGCGGAARSRMPRPTPPRAAPTRRPRCTRMRTPAVPGYRPDAAGCRVSSVRCPGEFRDVVRAHPTSSPPPGPRGAGHLSIVETAVARRGTGSQHRCGAVPWADGASR